MASIERFERLDHPALILSVPGKLQERIAELQRQLGDGNAGDWADYKHRVGVIRGLIEAVGICEEIEKELMRS